MCSNLNHPCFVRSQHQLHLVSVRVQQLVARQIMNLALPLGCLDRDTLLCGQGL